LIETITADHRPPPSLFVCRESDPMRCEDLIRELASPTGDLAPADIAGHLAVCPSCAEWSRRADRFDRIWEATRPIEPTADAMDALWARASVVLDARPIPAPLRLEGLSHRRRWAKAAFVVAQAAALLVAVLFLLRRDDVRPVEVAIVTPVEVTPGEDQTAIVRIDQNRNHQVVYHEEEVAATTSSIPPGTQHGLFNAIEGMASNAWESVASR
jgi:hypothetical protein